MIGQKVTITATPAAYTWNYGDGTIWGPTPIHGAPLNKDRIGEQTQTSHVYTETGRLAIGLTTHFNGTYTVNGGPELPIPGQGNIPQHLNRSPSGAPKPTSTPTTASSTPTASAADRRRPAATPPPHRSHTRPPHPPLTTTAAPTVGRRRTSSETTS
ncbi:hypothetical protein NHF46_10610 [Arthrobacter alpinus]|nr:hypothetical protein [Arthrobacter alpinus]